MKRLTFILLALAIALSCAGCTATVIDSPKTEEEMEEVKDLPAWAEDTVKLDEIWQIRDPFVILDEESGIYYLYGSQSPTGANGNQVSTDGHGFFCYKSLDLENWAGPFSAVRNDRLPEELKTDQYWAPEVHEYNGSYYLFGTILPRNSYRRTAIFKADSLEEEFTYWGQATPEGKYCLDATLYIEDGKLYSIYCEAWDSLADQNGLMKCVQLKDDLTGYLPETERLLFKANDTPACDGVLKVTDGCFMYRNRYGELFMLWSTFNNSGTNYLEVISKSSNGRLDGAWIHDPDPVYQNNGGHGMIFVDKEGFERMILHVPNSPNGIERAELFYLDSSVTGTLSLAKKNRQLDC